MNDTRQMRANTGNRIAFGVLILLVSLFVFICTCGAFGGVGEMVSSVFVGFSGWRTTPILSSVWRLPSPSFSISA